MQTKKKYSVDELVVFIEKHFEWSSILPVISSRLWAIFRQSVFRNYVSKYQTDGIKGLLSKKANQTYSREFKDQVVQGYVNASTSYKHLVLKRQIPSKETIRQWVLHYTEEKRRRYSPLTEVYIMKSRKTTAEKRNSNRRRMTG